MNIELPSDAIELPEDAVEVEASELPADAIELPDDALELPAEKRKLSDEEWHAEKQRRVEAEEPHFRATMQAAGAPPDADIDLTPLYDRIDNDMGEEFEYTPPVITPQAAAPASEPAPARGLPMFGGGAAAQDRHMARSFAKPLADSTAAAGQVLGKAVTAPMGAGTQMLVDSTNPEVRDRMAANRQRREQGQYGIPSTQSTLETVQSGVELAQEHVGRPVLESGIALQKVMSPALVTPEVELVSRVGAALYAGQPGYEQFGQTPEGLEGVNGLIEVFGENGTAALLGAAELVPEVPFMLTSIGVQQRVAATVTQKMTSTMPRAVYVLGEEGAQRAPRMAKLIDASVDATSRATGHAAGGAAEGALMGGLDQAVRPGGDPLLGVAAGGAFGGAMGGGISYLGDAAKPIGIATRDGLRALADEIADLHRVLDPSDTHDMMTSLAKGDPLHQLATTRNTRDYVRGQQTMPNKSVQGRHGPKPFGVTTALLDDGTPVIRFVEVRKGETNLYDYPINTMEDAHQVRALMEHYNVPRLEANNMLPWIFAVDDRISNRGSYLILEGKLIPERDLTAEAAEDAAWTRYMESLRKLAKERGGEVGYIETVAPDGRKQFELTIKQKETVRPVGEVKGRDEATVALGKPPPRNKQPEVEESVHVIVRTPSGHVRVVEAPVEVPPVKDTAEAGDDVVVITKTKGIRVGKVTSKKGNTVEVEVDGKVEELPEHAVVPADAQVIGQSMKPKVQTFKQRMDEYLESLSRRPRDGSPDPRPMEERTGVIQLADGSWDTTAVDMPNSKHGKEMRRRELERRAKIAEHENRIKGFDKEHLVYVDEKGTEHVGSASGKHVDTVEETAQGRMLVARNHNVTTSHNHPGPVSSLHSASDIGVAMRNNELEARVVGADDAGFSIRRPVKGWPKTATERLKLRDDLAAAVTRAGNRAIKKARKVNPAATKSYEDMDFMAAFNDEGAKEFNKILKPLGTEVKRIKIDPPPPRQSAGTQPGAVVQRNVPPGESRQMSKLTDDEALDKAYNELLASVPKNAAFTPKRMAEAFGIQQDEAITLLGVLEAEGVLKRTGSGFGTRWVHPDYTPPPRAPREGGGGKGGGGDGDGPPTAKGGPVPPKPPRPPVDGPLPPAPITEGLPRVLDIAGQAIRPDRTSQWKAAYQKSLEFFLGAHWSTPDPRIATAIVKGTAAKNMYAPDEILRVFQKKYGVKLVSKFDVALGQLAEGKMAPDGTRWSADHMLSDPELAPIWKEVQEFARPLIDEMRVNEQRIAELGGINDEVAELHALGVTDQYLARMYRVHMLPKGAWAKMIPMDIVREAAEAIINEIARKSPRALAKAKDGINADEIAHDILNILKADDPINEFFSNKKFGTALNHLKKRTSMPEWMKKLMGEETSGIIRMSQSVAAQRSIIANLELWQHVARDTTLSRRGRDMQNFPHQIPKNKRLYGEAAGRFVPEHVYRSLVELPKALDGSWGFWRAVAGHVKTMQIAAGGIKTWGNAIMGNVWYSQLAGGLDITRPLESGRSFALAFRVLSSYAGNPTAHRAGAVGDSLKVRVHTNAALKHSWKNDQHLAALLLEARRMGVDMPSMGGVEMGGPKNARVAAELNEVLNALPENATLWQMLEAFGRKMNSKGIASKEFLTNGYDLIDRTFKMANYISLRQRYLRVYKGDVEKAAVKAAEMINLSFPNPQLVGKSVDFMRKYPLIFNPYITFATENIRIHMQLPQRVAKDAMMTAKWAKQQLAPSTPRQPMAGPAGPLPGAAAPPIPTRQKPDGTYTTDPNIQFSELDGVSLRIGAALIMFGTMAEGVRQARLLNGISDEEAELVSEAQTDRKRGYRPMMLVPPVRDEKGRAWGLDMSQWWSATALFSGHPDDGWMSRIAGSFLRVPGEGGLLGKSMDRLLHNSGIATEFSQRPLNAAMQGLGAVASDLGGNLIPGAIGKEVELARQAGLGTGEDPALPVGALSNREERLTPMQWGLGHLTGVQAGSDLSSGARAEPGRRFARPALDGAMKDVRRKIHELRGARKGLMRQAIPQAEKERQLKILEGEIEKHMAHFDRLSALERQAGKQK